MRFTQAFEITMWDQSTYDDSGDLELGRASVAKNFASGDEEGGGLEGSSSAELLMVGTSAGPAAYTAVERFTGTLGGRDGSFVMVHGASADQTSSPGRIVAAVGDLTGLTGTVLFEHDDEGPRLTLDYDLL
ncbi:uncharacterized protein DUF3224 [Kribbella orskensis]|uniref:Uncharacterized protein DUF3224 n=1 Tax=Kribbella orskensis TaxID=2512216 RepID=A0ABY2BBA9_9ACTN|nr:MULTISPECIES: DUF3224 domain-containing protein [Kribbella]TCN33628.1 uncharacterized protein DUF3224 [Kribbella sp. VKM Ac-2500]TCO13965.1 uncharacterized protein DUF3224 [Kribbella orskensis]